jgi:hypothetical protein
MPTDQVRIYDAVSSRTRNAEGDLKLSRTSAVLPELSGEMRLRYAGMREGAGVYDFEFTGEVFEILNADEFFRLNQGRFCPEAVRWLTIRNLGSTSLGQIVPTFAQSIRLGMLTIRDWHDYDPSKPGACFGTTFQVRAS